MKHKKGVKVERLRRWKEACEIVKKNESSMFNVLLDHIHWLSKHAISKKTRRGTLDYGGYNRLDAWYFNTRTLLEDPTDEAMYRRILEGGW